MFAVVVVVVVFVVVVMVVVVEDAFGAGFRSVAMPSIGVDSLPSFAPCLLGAPPPPPPPPELVRTAPDEARRLCPCPPSNSIDRRPSTPSRVTAKK